MRSERGLYQLGDHAVRSVGGGDRKFYLIDTFSGPDFTQYSESEVNEGRVRVAQTALAFGSYVMDMDRVRKNYSQWPQVSFVKGTIPTVLASLVELECVAFVHIDLNCAVPEAAALEYFWPRLSKGGFVLLDDYAYFGCSEQGGMLDRSASRLGVEILTLPTGQGLMLK